MCLQVKLATKHLQPLHDELQRSLSQAPWQGRGETSARYPAIGQVLFYACMTDISKCRPTYHKAHGGMRLPFARLRPERSLHCCRDHQLRRQPLAPHTLPCRMLWTLKRTIRSCRSWCPWASPGTGLLAPHLPPPIQVSQPRPQALLYSSISKSLRSAPQDVNSVHPPVAVRIAAKASVAGR